MTGELLEVEGIFKSYGGIRVLRGVDLSVSQGEIHGLIGANGAGKSTLIDILCGQNRADAGTVRLAGRELSGPPSRRARVGLSRSFQQPQVAVHLTLRENIALGLSGTELPGLAAIARSAVRAVMTPRRLDDPRVDAVASRVGLADLHRLGAAVSFGEMRLVEVARAMISEPTLIVLDEPFPGVGDKGLSAVKDALQALRDQGQSVLLVDHNVDVVLALADCVSLLVQGQVAFRGTPQQCGQNDEFRSVYLGEQS